MRSRALLVAVLLLGCGARSGLDTSATATEAPDAAVVSAETCDGTDEDGDGRVDEGLAPLTCGDGECTREVPSCVDGRAATCPPIVATPEVCNRADDDCDGRIDEGLGFAPIGEPIVVREVDDGRTGSCSECGEVTGAQLVSFGRELHAIWFLRFSGYVEVPVAYARRLANDGHPIEGSRVFIEEATTRIALAPSHSGNTMASFCQRYEDRLDHPRARMFDGRGEAIGELLVPSLPDRRCYQPPTVVWTGERHVFLQAGALRPLVVDIADDAGRSIDVTELEWEDGALSVAFDGERMTLAQASPERSPTMALLELDPRGRPLDRPVLPFPSGADFDYWRGEVETLASPTGPLLAMVDDVPDGTERGSRLVFALFRYDRAAASLRLLTQIDGVGREEVELIRRSADEVLVALRVADRAASEIVVLRLSEDGEELDRWTLAGGAGVLETTEVHTHLGSVFVSYVRQLERGVNQVEVLELGCVE